MIPLKTPRLLLRRPTDADINPLTLMNSDPEVMRYIGDGSVPPVDPARTAAEIARFQRLWDERGFSMLSVIERESGDYAGWVLLNVPESLPEVMPAVEIGWRFRRESWGRGYATESARALLHFGLTDCALDRIIAIRHVDNVASKRVMNKLGLSFEREFVVPSHGRPVAVHAITKHDYNTHQN